MSSTLPAVSPLPDAEILPRYHLAGASAPRIVRSGGEGGISNRFLAAWAFGWALVGGLVALAIALTRGSMTDLGPLTLISILFAEVVGFTALMSARLVFPYFARLPLYARLALEVLTLFSGTVFGCVAVIATQPLYSLGRFMQVAVLVVVNACLAVIVGIAIQTYDSMRRQIEASYQTLREKEAMDREVAIAREVQRELLPRSIPRVRGLELAGVCLPAVGVGGDYFDFLPLAGDRVGVVIADVAGKGIPAALLMAGLQASVRSLALPGVAPSEVNRRLNEILYRSTPAARYSTFFFALFDSQDRVLTYSNAGHFPPFHLCCDGAVKLHAGGLPLGMLEGSLYGEGRRMLGVGDLIALYTDGIVEAPNEDDLEYGEERLIELLERHRGNDMDAIVRAVLEDVDRWSAGGPRRDDITLVLARAT